MNPTVSQNKVFDLVFYFIKLLIRLKVRTEMVLMYSIEPPYPAPFLKDQGPSFEAQVTVSADLGS